MADLGWAADGWDFDALDAEDWQQQEEVSSDWSPWDEPPGADRRLNVASGRFEPALSPTEATLNDSPPTFHVNGVEHEHHEHEHHTPQRSSFSGTDPEATIFHSARTSQPQQTTVQPHNPPHNHEGSGTEEDMPPNTRRRQLRNNSIVDLTQSPDSAADSSTRTSRPVKRRAESSADGGGTSKRRKKPTLSAAQLEEIDLENEAPSAEDELLQAQQMDALKGQNAGKEDDGPVRVGKKQCVICLESYTNAATSLCGHIFCHECLTRALIASEKNGDRRVGTCPSCRTPISRTKAAQIIPINFLKKSAFQSKGRSTLETIH